MFRRLDQIVVAFRHKLAVYRLVLQDERTPRLSKWLLGIAVAYALSPVDLIPDWIPVLGLLDDLIVVPALIGLANLGIPAQVWMDARVRELGRETSEGRRV